MPTQAGNDAPFEEKLLASIPSQYKEPGQYREAYKASESYRGPDFEALVGVTFETSGRGWTPILSPDRKTVAYRAKQGNKEFIVAGDKKGEEFDEVRDHVFSPDGKTVAYRARINKRWFIVLGEQKGVEYDKVGPPSFSPDGKKLAYAARVGKLSFIIDGNEKGPEFAQVSSPVFSPDGGRIAYVGYGNGKCSLVMTGKTIAEYYMIGDFTFAPTGGSFAYSAAVFDGKHLPTWFVVVGDKPGRVFSFVLAPAFNSDGSKVVYLARDLTGKGLKSYIVIGDDPQPPKTLGSFSLPVFSPDGSRVAYFAGYKPGHFTKPKPYLFDGNQLVETYGFNPPYEITVSGVDRRDRQIVFSPDGRLIAYRIEQGKGAWGTAWRIVIGMQVGPHLIMLRIPCSVLTVQRSRTSR